MNIEPIGTVKSPITEGLDENWGTVVSTIELVPDLMSGLQGIEQFSHLVIIFFMHQFQFNPSVDLVRRPRGRADMPLLGCFAQRAKHRPNPIGITTVELVGVEGNTLKVCGLDAVDGTPVLDIKPYYPAFDSVKEDVDVKVPDWVNVLMEGYF
jgi:tRNA-Thr(GGU) m(6)t(6)A37 methyltransferase TsaA